MNADSEIDVTSCSEGVGNALSEKVGGRLVDHVTTSVELRISPPQALVLSELVIKKKKISLIVHRIMVIIF